MLKIILSGCNGAMGQVITGLVEKNDNLKIVAGFDRDVKRYNNGFPIYSDMHLCKEEADVIIDFSHYSAFDDITNFAKERRLPIVMATTGLSKENEEYLRTLSKEIAIFRSANMSLGINVILDLVRRATKTLAESFDIEIIEKHHNKKVDAPSGTALMLADAVDQSLEESSHRVFGRHGKNEKREKKDVGIHAIRGGTIVGEHTVLYAGMDELIEIKHTALSKNIFAVGAIKAAGFIAGKNSGYYNMEKLLNENQ